MRQVRGLALVVLAALAAAALPPAAAQAQQKSAQAIVQAGAAALGGADRIKSTRNITLYGYGQYAYMFGGGRIATDPNAPEKYIAANELSRVYDLEHDRFQMQERRNMLFPFLATFGHSFAPNNWILDGDVAFNLQGKDAVRQPKYSEGALWVDGSYMRRMWMLNNPVALVRALMASDTRITVGGKEKGADVVNAVLKGGEQLSVGFGADGLPTFVRWRVPHPNLGETTYTTAFSGWGEWGGLQMPLGYTTNLDWRNIEYFKVYVDNYSVDGTIADLSAPAAVKAAPEPASYPVPQLSHVTAAPGIWRISNGSIVIEFADHLTMFELGLNTRQAQAVLDYAETLAPGKKVTQLVTSHNHFDHIAGLRQAIAKGITIIARRPNGEMYKELANRKAVEFKDDLSNAPQALKFMPVDERLRLSDATQTVDIYWVRNNIHMADAVFAHVPKEKLIIEGDIATAAYDYQFWPDNLEDNLERYKLEVERLVPVHDVLPDENPILSMPQVRDLIRGGTERAREKCRTEIAHGNYFAGCPVHSKRY